MILRTEEKKVKTSRPNAARQYLIYLLARRTRAFPFQCSRGRAASAAGAADEKKQIFHFSYCFVCRTSKQNTLDSEKAGIRLSAYYFRSSEGEMFRESRHSGKCLLS